MSIIQATALLLENRKMKKGWGEKSSQEDCLQQGPPYFILSCMHPGTQHPSSCRAPTAAAGEPTSAINLPHYIFVGELRLWRKIQGQGKGTSKSRNKEMPRGLCPGFSWEIWQINCIHECKKVFFSTFGFDHFTRRGSLLAKQHWPTGSHAEHQRLSCCSEHHMESP